MDGRSEPSLLKKSLESVGLLKAVVTRTRGERKVISYRDEEQTVCREKRDLRVHVGPVPNNLSVDDEQRKCF